MCAKKVSVVINPRAGQNIAKITDVLAVLAAAGWKTKTAMKEYYEGILGVARGREEQAGCDQGHTCRAVAVVMLNFLLCNRKQNRSEGVKSEHYKRIIGMAFCTGRHS